MRTRREMPVGTMALMILIDEENLMSGENKKWLFYSSTTLLYILYIKAIRTEAIGAPHHPQLM